MGSVAGTKKIERAITSALSVKSAQWRKEQMAAPEIAARAKLYPIDQVLEVAAQITGVPADVLRGPTRSRNVAWPRHFAVVLLHHARRDLSYPQLGKIFGGRDHSSVKHALDRQRLRRLYPECESWYADPRAVAILAGTEYSGVEQ
jgi:chromosomal replication initiation ATPase DnaA